MLLESSERVSFRLNICVDLKSQNMMNSKTLLGQRKKKSTTALQTSLYAKSPFLGTTYNIYLFHRQITFPGIFTAEDTTEVYSIKAEPCISFAPAIDFSF